jgi:hypothetical protein
VTVTTQNGTISLPGAALTLTDADGQPIATQVTDEQGQARFSMLPAGEYVVAGALAGFDAGRVTSRVQTAHEVTVRLDLPVSGVTEHVDVVGSGGQGRPTIATALAPKAVLDSHTVEQLPIHDNSVLSALKLLAGIVDGPSGVSIKGGRPNQSALQIGLASLADPTTGTPLFRLPADAVDSVEVFSNPYAVEFGRFSSGMTVVNTKRAGDVWRVFLNSPDISFRTVRDHPLELKGIESFGPRIGFGGPLVKGRVFLEESAQMRYDVSELRSRPQDDTRVTKWLSAFTRVDANLTPNQTITGTLNFFPSRTDDATLSTFNGPQVAADVNDTLLIGNISARTTLFGAAMLESTLQMAGFDVDVGGHGTAPMELLPAGNTGNFYNRQHRQTDTTQWAEAITTGRNIGGVQHLFKFGADLMRTAFAGTSSSSPVEVRRDDGTLARRLTFGRPIAQDVSATDVAAFAQDRVQLASRVLVEAGGRLDRDGVLQRVNATPRVGAVVLLNSSGTATLRGGYGLFFERTPSVVGAFSQFEPTTDTRFAADGVTALAAPMLFVHRTAADLDTARSATWNLSLDDRLGPAWSFRAALLQRDGANELIVEPISADDMSQLLLSSEGRSSYQEAEFTLRYTPGPRFDVSGSYVRSSSHANLNAHTAFFDNVRWPIVGVDAYAPTASDAPNRLVTQVRALPGSHWLLSSVVEVRTGFPYSATDAALDWVGPRNEQYRFPTVASVDLGVERQISFFSLKPWIGVRVYNALDRFNPGEVQANLASPAFGSFYNSYPRQIRLQIRLDR